MKASSPERIDHSGSGIHEKPGGSRRKRSSLFQRYLAILRRSEEGVCNRPADLRFLVPTCPRSIRTIPRAILGDTSSSTLSSVWNVSHIARGSVLANLLDESCSHRILDNSRPLRFLFAKPKRPTNVCVHDGHEVNVGKAGLHVARAGAVLLCCELEGLCEKSATPGYFTGRYHSLPGTAQLIRAQSPEQPASEPKALRTYKNETVHPLDTKTRTNIRHSSPLQAVFCIFG